ncbi:alpha-amylase family protein [Lysinibacillus pakistanensis]|uniref:alpha-amylase family protein n=1 Tax=Lysinibacillus pakistanensis TaxID=759811 RepID=UPI003D2CCD0C
MQDPKKFAGGDFAGLQDKLKFIGEMGFTIVSIGPVFATEKYDGSMLTSYSTIERHFGTSKEFQSVVEAYKAKNM